jgi:hypothetical protein
MSHHKHDIARIETIATLDTVESIVVGLCAVFREVSEGTPLNPRQAARLAAQCVVMLEHLVEVRNNLRLAGSCSAGVH